MPAGRFVPGRFFEEQPDLPNWANDPAPRLSAAYDLFGDGRTAIKGNVSKSYAQWSAGWARRYAKSASSSDSRNWFDCAINAAGTACSGVALPTNADGIAQDNEIGPSSSPTSGLRADRNPAEGSNVLTTGIQRRGAAPAHVARVDQFRVVQAHLAGLQVSDRGADFTRRLQCVPTSDAELCKRSGPGRGRRAGSERDDHGLQPEPRKAQRVWIANRGQNSDDQSIYDGIELSFSSRLPAGGTLFGGWTTSETCRSSARQTTILMARRSPTSSLATTWRVAAGSATNAASTCRSRTSSSWLVIIRCRLGSISAPFCRATPAANGWFNGSRQRTSSRAEERTPKRSSCPSQDLCIIRATTSSI